MSLNAYFPLERFLKYFLLPAWFMTFLEGLFIPLPAAICCRVAPAGPCVYKTKQTFFTLEEGDLINTTWFPSKSHIPSRSFLIVLFDSNETPILS